MIIIRLESGECAAFPLSADLQEMARFTKGRLFMMVVREGVK